MAEIECPDCNHWHKTVAELRREIGVLQFQLTRERNDNSAHLRTIAAIREQLEAAQAAWSVMQR